MRSRSSSSASFSQHLSSMHFPALTSGRPYTHTVRPRESGADLSRSACGASTWFLTLDPSKLLHRVHEGLRTRSSPSQSAPDSVEPSHTAPRRRTRAAEADDGAAMKSPPIHVPPSRAPALTGVGPDLRTHPTPPFRTFEPHNDLRVSALRAEHPRQAPRSTTPSRTAVCRLQLFADRARREEAPHGVRTPSGRSRAHQLSHKATKEVAAARTCCRQSAGAVFPETFHDVSYKTFPLMTRRDLSPNLFTQ